MKFIFVSGGVISGLGKGITTASIAMLLESHGIRVAPIKCEAYMNVDSGTIRPQEHGEVFVLDDGLEGDQDLGNYERFLNRDLTRENFVTNGQIYQEIIRKERAFEYHGEDVEIVPHVPEEMIRRFKLAGKKHKADVVIIEVGGTVGEYQNVLFIEANRIMKYRDKEDVIHIHLGYLPTPAFLGEMKSKPVQTSVRILSGTGIMPDFIVGRAEKEIDDKRKERLAWLCNIDGENVISNPDVDTIYRIPEIFKKQGFDKKIMAKLGLKSKKNDYKKWHDFITKVDSIKKTVKIAIVGKYFNIGDYVLPDSYISVIEAIKHGAWANDVKPEFTFINCEDFELNEEENNKKTEEPFDITQGRRQNNTTKEPISKLKEFDGVVIPQGWGSRGVEGKINAIKYLREHKIPYLGLCFGMQMAVIEFARNVCGLKDANSEEVDENTKNPVIHIMPNQKEYLKKHQYGGTIRLGAYPCTLKNGSIISEAYKNFQFSIIPSTSSGPLWGNFQSNSNDKNSKLTNQPFDDTQGRPINLSTSLEADQLTVSERHRHRYEFNNEYRDIMEKKGLVISGTSPDGELVEAIELSKKVHPFFVGVQSHPEYKSRPLSPHPIFVEFIRSCNK